MTTVETTIGQQTVSCIPDMKLVLELNSALKEDMIEMNERICNLELENGTNIRRIVKFEKETKELREENKEMKKQIQELKQENKIFKQENKIFKQENKNMNQKINKLEENMSRLNQNEDLVRCVSVMNYFTWQYINRLPLSEEEKEELGEESIFKIFSNHKSLAYLGKLLSSERNPTAHPHIQSCIPFKNNIRENMKRLVSENKHNEVMKENMFDDIEEIMNSF